jgi:hypothetical protein
LRSARTGLPFPNQARRVEALPSCSPQACGKLPDPNAISRVPAEAPRRRARGPIPSAVAAFLIDSGPDLRLGRVLRFKSHRSSPCDLP